jgi:hypothetical protein
VGERKEGDERLKEWNYFNMKKMADRRRGMIG